MSNIPNAQAWNKAPMNKKGGRKTGFPVALTMMVPMRAGVGERNLHSPLY